VSKSNGYYTDILEIKEGAYNPDEFKAMPAMFFMEESDNTLEALMGNRYVQDLRILVRLHARNNTINDTSIIDRFEFDIKKFLRTDWTFKADTDLEEETKKFKGGGSIPLLLTEFYFTVKYTLQF
jgi:hypothetical protein